MECSNFKMHQHDFAAYDFCQIQRGIPFSAHSLFADCHFNLHLGSDSSVKEKLIGPGIYAICYDQQLVYIGKYLGQKKNPFAGNVVRLRWLQHLGSMTMRDRRVSLSKRSINVLLDPNFSHSHYELIESLALAFENDGSLGSTMPFLQRDRGCLSTVNRVLFALENWPLFSKADGPDLEGFSFHYFRVERPNAEIWTEALRALISNLEDCLVEKFRPPCNAVISSSTALSGKCPHILNALRGEIMRFLQTDVEQTSRAQPMAKLINVEPMAIIEKGLVEPEETSAEVRFFERLESAPPEAESLIEELRLYASKKDDVELHYTSTNRGDLRLRKHSLVGSNRGSRNFLTLLWQSRDQTFLINNICQSVGSSETAALSAFIRPLSSGPLKSTMKIDARTALAKKKTLMEWIEKGRMALALQS